MGALFEVSIDAFSDPTRGVILQGPSISFFWTSKSGSLVGTHWQTATFEGEIQSLAPSLLGAHQKVKPNYSAVTPRHAVGLFRLHGLAMFCVVWVHPFCREPTFSWCPFWGTNFWLVFKLEAKVFPVAILGVPCFKRHARMLATFGMGANASAC